jgi:hypothetical protein
MQTPGLLDSFPLWTLLPLTIFIALLSVEVGYRLARYRRQRSDEEQGAPVGGMVGATLGLFAFMLAFTFGFAGSRFEDKRQVLLSEANAIGDTYRCAAMLPEPIRTETRTQLREYVEVRLEAVQPAKLAQSMSRSEELHQLLWSQAVAATEKDRSAVTVLFVKSLNDVIDLHSKRVMAALRSRVPAAIWIVLYLLTILSMAAVGYHEGLSSKRRSLAVVMLVLGFSAVLFLIVDLDRPGQGLLQVSQQSMLDLKKSMTDR